MQQHVSADEEPDADHLRETLSDAEAHRRNVV
jgi:hypothetical protein